MNGRCYEVLAQHFGPHLALDDTSVYGVYQPGAGSGVGKIAKSGGTPTVLNTLPLMGEPGGIAVDATDVYFTIPANGCAPATEPIVGSVPKNGGPVTLVAGGNATMCFSGGVQMETVPAGPIALTPTGVVWTEEIQNCNIGGGGVRRVSKSGGPTITLWTPPGSPPGQPPPPFPELIVAQGPSVYWTTRAGYEAPTIMTQGKTIVPPPPNWVDHYFAGLAVDATSVYYIDAYSNAVMKAPIGGGTPTMLAPTASATGALAVDDTSVYWSDYSAINKVPIGGGAPVVVLPGIGATEIVVDATSLYLGSGQLVKVTPK